MNDPFLQEVESRDSEYFLNITFPNESATGCSSESKLSRKDEIKAMMKLVGPVMMITFLEFLPEFMTIVLAGNLNEKDTSQYVNAATFSLMLFNLTTTAIGFGLASALDTLCSQAYGAKRYDKIGVYFQTGCLVLSANLILVGTATWYAEDILKWLGQDEEVARLSADFSRCLFPGIPFLCLYELTRKVLQSQNIIAPLVVIVVIGNVVNISAGYGLAYHTSLGFNGIAIGTSIGNMSLAILLVPYFMWRPHHLNQWWVHPWNLKAATRYLGAFLRLGIPGMLMDMMEMWGMETLSILSGLLPNGIEAVAAHSVLVNVNMLVDTTFYGFSVAANIRVGNYLGAGSFNHAKLARTVALQITFVISCTFAVLLFSFSGVIPRLILGGSESAALASKVMAIWAPLTVVDGLNTVCQGVCRGAGKQKSAAISNAVAYYAAGIPFGAYLAFQCHLGVEGLWFGTGLGDILAVTALMLLMKYRWNWEKLADDATKQANN